jgi:hypothetical protein
MNRNSLAIAGTALLVVGAALVSAMLLNRAVEERALDRMWFRLGHPQTDSRFDPAEVTDLPEPARRFLLHAIEPGTVLATSVVLHMKGTLRLKEDADPLPMHAVQVLAPPRGFIWRADVGHGLMRIRGFDRYAGGAAEMRWWLLGLVPVVSQDGAGVTRSAAGRMAGEGILVPSALLPSRGARWEPVDESTARVTLDVDGERVSFTVRVAPDGRPERVVIRRWNGDPASGDVGYLPFMVVFDGEERTFGGYTIPVSLRAGWAPGGSFRPFFTARLEDAAYH